MIRTHSGNREALVAVEVVLELLPGDELHRDERDALVLAVLVNGDDVRMVETSRRLRFALEPLDHLAASGSSSWSRRMVLIAARRPMTGSQPSSTSAIAPAPSTRGIS
jgi:hypothetical protein